MHSPQESQSERLTTGKPVLASIVMALAWQPREHLPHFMQADLQFLRRVFLFRLLHEQKTTEPASFAGKRTKTCCGQVETHTPQPVQTLGSICGSPLLPMAIAPKEHAASQSPKPMQPDSHIFVLVPEIAAARQE